jgi:hypothetical protein
MALKNQNILFDVRLHNHEDWNKATHSAKEYRDHLCKLHDWKQASFTEHFNETTLSDHLLLSREGRTEEYLQGVGFVPMTTTVDFAKMGQAKFQNAVGPFLLTKIEKEQRNGRMELGHQFAVDCGYEERRHGSPGNFATNVLRKNHFFERMESKKFKHAVGNACLAFMELDERRASCNEQKVFMEDIGLPGDTQIGNMYKGTRKSHVGSTRVVVHAFNLTEPVNYRSSLYGDGCHRNVQDNFNQRNASGELTTMFLRNGESQRRPRDGTGATHDTENAPAGRAGRGGRSTIAGRGANPGRGGRRQGQRKTARR